MTSAAPFTIRSGTPDDAAGLATLAARTFAETFAGCQPDADLALFLDETYGVRQQSAELADPATVTIIVEDAAGEMIGFAQLRAAPVPSHADAPAPFELWRFYVDRPWHGRGVAPALMSHALTIARAQGAVTLWLSVWEHNERALAFYRKSGFDVAGSKVFMVGTDRQIDHVMVRSLEAGTAPA